MTGPEFTNVNGLKVCTEHISEVGTNPDSSKQVRFKNGVSAIILNKQNYEATLYSYDDVTFSSDSNITLGYNLNGVTIFGNSPKKMRLY